MKKLSASQLVGPVALFTAVMGAEAASYCLSRTPSSEWMWYFNLQWFGMFQQSHYALKDHLGVDCEQLFVIALPLFLSGCIGFAFRRSLLLALASNFSFLYFGLVFYTWYRARSFPMASLVAEHLSPAEILSNPDLIILLILGTLSLFSFMVSHIAYIQKARAAF